MCLLFGWFYNFISHTWSLSDQTAHAQASCLPKSESQSVICFRCCYCMSVIMAHMTTRGLAHSTSSLQLTSCFLSVHLLFIRQLFALDFSQAFTVSGLHSKSANGLSLSRWSGENRIHMEAVIENVWFITNCWWGVTSKQERTLKWHLWNTVQEVRKMLDASYLLLIHMHVSIGLLPCSYNFRTGEPWLLRHHFI